MKNLNKESKKAKYYICLYEKSTIITLRQAYETFSDEKEQALYECYKKQNKCNGTYGRIVTASKFIFTYGFRCGTNYEDLVIITKTYDYYIKGAFKQ